MRSAIFDPGYDSNKEMPVGRSSQNDSRHFSRTEANPHDCPTVFSC